MANLLTDLSLTSAYTVTGSWANITDMSDTVTVAGTGSVVILMMSLTPELTSTDECAEYRFTSGGSPVGPVLSSFADGADMGQGLTIMFALTGLSAGSHTFAVQAINRLGTAVIDTGYTRTFQVVEIESGATLLVDKASTAANAASGSYANMTGLSDTQTSASGSILLFIAGVQMLDGDDESVDFRFAIDGSRDGPTMTETRDATDACNGLAMAWAESGVSAASHTFSLQWKQRYQTADMDTGRQRTFQVIEFTTNTDLLVDIQSVTAQDAPATYADMTDMSGTPDIDSTDSIVLLLMNYTPEVSGDDRTADHRFSVGGVQEGAEISSWTDASSSARADALLMARAVTGESGSTAVSLQWQRRNAIAATETSRPRTFQVLDLKAVAGSGPSALQMQAYQGMERMNGGFRK